MAGGQNRVTGTMAVAAGAGAPRLGRAMLRQTVPLFAAALLVFLMRDRIAALEPGVVRDAFARITPGAWAGAAAATIVSFLALGRYDAVLHRFLGTGIGPAEARRAGMAAIAISQTTGFGLVTGALVRWRMLPGLSLWQSVRLTTAVTGWFLAAWAVLTAAVVVGAPITGPLAAPWMRGAAALVLLAAGGGLCLCVLAPQPAIFGRALRLPPLPALGRLLLYVTADTFAAALALWMLMPEGAAEGGASLLAAYLVALGAGLVLATPGGIGPFEFALVGLLPGTGQDGLLAAAVGFRLIYFAIPALGAAVLLAFGPQMFGPQMFASASRTCADAPPAAVLVPPEVVAEMPQAAKLLACAVHAETGILRQGEHGLLLSPDGARGWVAGRGHAALVALFDPMPDARHAPALLGALRLAAREADLVPCLYKCSARTAAVARRAGWAVRRVAVEQILDPRAASGFAGPAHAGLRRKLRKAERAGVEVALADGRALPVRELDAVATAWAAARGGERGFSIGRYAPGYVRAQRVYLARQGGRTVAFASFHEGWAEWVLDLMRALPDAPDGAMHAIVARAVADAAAGGVGRLSLAALPPSAGGARARRELARLIRRTGSEGLRQFKAGFAPRPEARYVCAPTWPALAVALLDILRAVHLPGTLPGTGLPGGPEAGAGAGAGATVGPDAADPGTADAAPADAAPADAAPPDAAPA